jgi:hypothetical protein
VNDFIPIGYSNSEFVGDKQNGFSTSCCLMSLISVVVSWKSLKQQVLVDSTIKSKYVAVVEETKNIVSLKKILEDCRRNG